MKTWQNLTDLLFEEDVNAEMVKKYRGTVLGILNNSTPIYATYQGVSNKGYHCFMDSNTVSLNLSKETDCTVFIPKIAKGLYNTEKDCVFVSRNPYRQYKRGLTRDSVCIEPLSAYVIGGQTSNQFSNTIFQVLDSSKQTEVSLQEAITHLTNVPSYAINREFAVTLPHSTIQDCDASLWLHTNFIGVVRGKIIQVINPIFTQEILDSQDSWCSDYTVV